jgi:hypothetical protein
VSEFFLSIGGRDLSSEGDEWAEEDEMNQPHFCPSWAVAKARYEDASRKRLAWRKQCAEHAGAASTAGAGPGQQQQQQQQQAQGRSYPQVS